MHNLFVEMHGALNPVIAAIAPPGRSGAEISRMTAFVFSLLFGSAKLNPLHDQMLGAAGAWPDPGFIDDLCHFAISAIAAGRGG